VRSAEQRRPGRCLIGQGTEPSTDPELVAKVTDVVGLYLHPPENAIVLSIDELGRDEAR
jgi:hypothetical protein